MNSSPAAGHVIPAWPDEPHHYIRPARIGDRPRCALHTAAPPCMWTYWTEYTAAPGRWPLRVSCCATGPLAALHKMRRAFPPEPGTRLAGFWYAP